LRVANCHPDRKHHSKGFCRSCYYKEEYKKNKTVYIQRCKNYRVKNKTELSNKAYTYRLKRKFNLSNDDYNELLISQNGVCAICKKMEPNRRLAIDHSHTTGQVRGLLCFKCNSSLGGFDDSVIFLENAINYLKGKVNG